MWLALAVAVCLLVVLRMLLHLVRSVRLVRIHLHTTKGYSVNMFNPCTTDGRTDQVR